MLHLNMSTKKVTKIFLELRYKEIFSLPENKFKILDKLSKNFSEFDTNQADRIVMFSPEKRLTAHIFINRLTIDWDDPTSITDFNKICAHFIKTLNSVIKIEEPKRIGIRTFLGFKVENQKEIENYILNKFFSANAKNTSEIADEIYNPRLQISGRKGNILFNFGIGTFQEQIIQGELPKPAFAVVNNYLNFDIDVYKESGISVNNPDSFLNTTQDFIDNKMIQYIKSV
ncbi:hypothetical protein [Bacillus sp. JJ1764]|uniref:hypothetical protein n=1 Tax=Bacillus sp. JJ1764 TaxID=3122964 RepID=UPI002FFFE27F